MHAPQVGVLLIDDRRIFVAANEVAAELIGVSEDKLIGAQTDDFMPLIARPLYPVAWRSFVLRGTAFGDYAAQRPDGSLQRLAYAGFANRPIKGLHFFVLRALSGEIDPAALVPSRRGDHIQVGLELPPDVRERLVHEADREEWHLPVSKGGQRAILAALFESPKHALDALDALRELGAIQASIATAAGATAEMPLTLLAGRVPYTLLGDAMHEIRDRGGRIMGNFDERRTGNSSPNPH